MAHEFGHVEYAQTAFGHASLWYAEWAKKWLDNQLKALGTVAYSRDPKVAVISQVNDKNHSDNEKSSDASGKGIVDNFKLCIANKPGC